MLSEDEENGRDGQTSPQTISPRENSLHQQTTNPTDSFSPSQQPASDGTDDLSTINPSNEYSTLSSNKIPISTNLPVSSSSSISTTLTSKRLTGTLNRLLHSAVNRPNGHHYNHLVNGSASSPSASSSTNTTNINDGINKEPKLTTEFTTQAIESKMNNVDQRSSLSSALLLAFIQHFDSSFNTMTYFQEKLQQLLISIARQFIRMFQLANFFFRVFLEERDNYRTLYLREHDRRLQVELRLKESNTNPMV